MSDKGEVVKRLVGLRCPECKEEIEDLSYNSSVAVTQIFRIDEDDCADYSAMEEYGEHSDERWVCPECYEILFEDEDKAVKFLKGEG